MKKLLKFNQRARLVADDTVNYSFGIIVNQTDDIFFSFDLVNNKEEFIDFINLNEWKIEYSGQTRPVIPVESRPLCNER